MRPVDWSKHVGAVGKVGDWHGTRELLVRGPRPPAGMLYSVSGMHLERILGDACLAANRVGRATLPSSAGSARDSRDQRRVVSIGCTWWDAAGVDVVREISSDIVIVTRPIGPWGEPRSIMVGFGADGMACAMLVQRDGLVTT